MADEHCQRVAAVSAKHLIARETLIAMRGVIEN